MDRDTGRVNLRKTRIGEVSALLVALQSCGTVAVHRVGREEICIAVAAGGDHYSMCAEPLKLSGHKIAGDNALGLTVDNHEIKHLVTRI